jgi:putative holliday junction resolvase
MLLLWPRPRKERRIPYKPLKIRHYSHLCGRRKRRKSPTKNSVKRAYNASVNPAQNRLMGRVLGLDVGSRRIGLAVSDPLGITAQGLDTLQRKNKRHDFEALRRLIAAYEVKEIVIGLPLRMSGIEGTQAAKMQAFAEELRRRFQLPVHLWDERLTSAEANRLLRENELSIEKRGQAVDRIAAVLILQGWMENRRHTAALSP